ncbi:MAG TPA: hypothetical protein VMI54_05075 [Polyangiaceae bacterium]|nr:hypothetical protein [Polyangiaceae bacterium]
MLGEKINPAYQDVNALSPACRTLFNRFAKNQAGRYSFVCAQSPSSEIWVTVASLALPPNPRTEEAVGTWQIIVQRGDKSLKSAPQHFRLFASHSGGVCQTDPADCLRYGHYAGVLEPVGFVFVDVDQHPPYEAFAMGREEFDNSTAPEAAVSLWHIGADKLEVDPLSEHTRIAGVADCDGDQVPELAINPYRSASNKFLLRFDGHARATSERWTELLSRGPGGAWSYDGAVSRRYAARLCPTAPEEPFAGPPEQWPGAMHCAKLWCRADHLEERLDRACHAPADEQAARFCADNLTALRTMSRTSVPCLLPAPPSNPLPAGCFDEAMAEGE